MRFAEAAFIERGGHYTVLASEILPLRGFFLNTAMSGPDKHFYEFGSFRLEPAEHSLLRDGRVVPLRPKVFDILRVLVERHGHLVEKEELMRAVWPEDEFVEEGNLNKNISLLRKALGEGEDGVRYIETVPKRGYRFTADILTVSGDSSGPELVVETRTHTSLVLQEETGEEPRGARAPARPYQTNKESPADIQLLRQRLEVESQLERSAPLASSGTPTTDGVTTRLTPRRGFIIAAVLLTLTLGALAYVWRWRQSSVTPPAEIKSLAVLPLKSLDADENYMGLGIADAVIRRVSQTGRLIVRPTSAVRRYLNEETDAITAARQLNADAVLEGSLQRDDDRLRVSFSLLRTSDGASLWAESFDMRMTDIFAIQDTVAQQVASRLRLQLDPAQQARLNKRSTSNQNAFEYYVKGVYSLDQRGFGKDARPQTEATIALFKKAIEADPDYALAHAQLAYAYIWMALFNEQQAVWAERAKEETNRADALDPQLAETHVARHWLLRSAYEGWQTEAAARELLLAQQLNPNVGHVELGDLYNHLGLEDLSDREYQRALDIDPTSQHVKYQIVDHYAFANKHEEALAALQKFKLDDPIPSPLLMGLGRLDEAQKQVDEHSVKYPDDPGVGVNKALLSALKGDVRTAEAEIPSILSKLDPQSDAYHHITYRIACVYALSGKSDEAVKWLRESAAKGFPSYTLFERDPYLDRIRRAPEFIRFMKEMKARHERYQSEFS